MKKKIIKEFEFGTGTTLNLSNQDEITEIDLLEHYQYHFGMKK